MPPPRPKPRPRLRPFAIELGGTLAFVVVFGLSLPDCAEGARSSAPWPRPTPPLSPELRPAEEAGASLAALERTLALLRDAGDAGADGFSLLEVGNPEEKETSITPATLGEDDESSHEQSTTLDATGQSVRSRKDAYEALISDFAKRHTIERIVADSETVAAAKAKLSDARTLHDSLELDADSEMHKVGRSSPTDAEGGSMSNHLQCPRITDPKLVERAWLERPDLEALQRVPERVESFLRKGFQLLDRCSRENVFEVASMVSQIHAVLCAAVFPESDEPMPNPPMLPLTAVQLDSALLVDVPMLVWRGYAEVFSGAAMVGSRSDELRESRELVAAMGAITAVLKPLKVWGARHFRSSARAKSMEILQQML